jgi:thymidylate synthase
MGSVYETTYLNILKTVLAEGERRPSRAGNVLGTFGIVFTVNCREEFNLLTTRQIFYKPVLGELAAFLSGRDDLQTFKRFGCHYWNANAGAWKKNKGVPPIDQRVGRIYGVQWRNWGYEIDQLAELIEGLQVNPFNRRHIVTAWNPTDRDDMCLPPCHIMFQCYVSEGELHMQVYMRSVDLCLGLPSDVVLYQTLLLILANECELRPGNLTMVLGDAHIYENHIELAKAQLKREPWDLPAFKLNRDTGIDSFRPEDLTIVGYDHEPAIAYPLNV